jgi:hypothetical protein
VPQSGVVKVPPTIAAHWDPGIAGAVSKLSENIIVRVGAAVGGDPVGVGVLGTEVDILIASMAHSSKSSPLFDS